MSTTTTPRHRIYRLEGEKKAINFEMPKADYECFRAFANHCGWSVGEATRRAIASFLAQNMDITDDLCSPPPEANGHKPASN